MEKISLRERLLRYFKKNHSAWIPSGQIQRLVVEYTTQTPRTCVRRLQEMAEEGLLERKIVKGHTHYKLSQSKETPTSDYLDSLRRSQIAFFEGYGVHTA